MKPIRIFFKLAIGILAGTGLGQGTNSAATASTPAQLPDGHVVAVKTPDGVTLKASYFAAARPGPGVLLFHQSNRMRQSWDDLARQMAAADIHTLTIDVRGYGESGGRKEARELYQDLRSGRGFRISGFSAGRRARCSRHGRGRMAGCGQFG